MEETPSSVFQTGGISLVNCDACRHFAGPNNSNLGTAIMPLLIMQDKVLSAFGDKGNTWPAADTGSHYARTWVAIFCRTCSRSLSSLQFFGRARGRRSQWREAVSLAATRTLGICCRFSSNTSPTLIHPSTRLSTPRSPQAASP